MKRYIAIVLAVLAVGMTMPMSGCKGNNESKIEAQQDPEMAAQLEQLKERIDALTAKADELYGDGRLDEEKYQAVKRLSENLADIGSEATNENRLKLNELTKQVNDLEYDLSAIEDPQQTDVSTALTSLMDCITELEPTITSAHTDGKLPDDRFAQFNEYKAEVQGYIDGTKEKDENISERLAEIRSDVTTMASQAEADNEVIDKLLAKPVTVQDSTQLEELVSSYIELQDEVMKKVENKELTEAKLNELLTTGVKVAQVKEALRTGNITDETRQTMQECNTELKVFAESIGSKTAENFK